jgi:hypothetical protein
LLKNGFFFNAIARQEHLDDSKLKIEDNLEGICAGGADMHLLRMSAACEVADIKKRMSAPPSPLQLTH